MAISHVEDLFERCAAADGSNGVAGRARGGMQQGARRACGGAGQCRGGARR